GTGLPSSSNAGVFNQSSSSIGASRRTAGLRGPDRSVGVGGGEAAQPADRRGRVLGSVDGGSGDEDVGAGVDDAFDRRGRDSPVDLQADLESGGGDRLTGPSDLRQASVEELLAAEPGFDGHDQDVVEFAEEVDEGFDRGGGLEREAGLRPQPAQFAGQPHGG